MTLYGGSSATRRSVSTFGAGAGFTVEKTVEGTCPLGSTCEGFFATEPRGYHRDGAALNGSGAEPSGAPARWSCGYGRLSARCALSEGNPRGRRASGAAAPRGSARP